MSRPAKTSTERRADLERAIKATKRGDRMSLTEIADFWGVDKGTICNLRGRIRKQGIKFPEGVKDGQQTYHPRMEVLKALQAWETRNDAVAAARSAKLKSLMGGKADPRDAHVSPSELLKIDDLNARAQRRAIEQGQLLRAEDVAQIMAKVFSRLSSRLGNIASLIDPNGLLDALSRKRLTDNGRKLLLETHADLNDMLSPDADRNPTRTPAPRKRGGKAI
jgi:hypothetical protein